MSSAYSNKNKNSSQILLRALDGYRGYVIGYAYHPGGYKPWPKCSRNYYCSTVHRMKKQGWIKESKRGGKKFLKLTKKGRVQALLCKLKSCGPQERQQWDGKWRLAIFDIPENGKLERNRIRKALKLIGFHRLQKSVYIFPYGLPREAVLYLKESSLDKYIRFLRVDEVDDDRDIKRKFKIV